MAKKVRNSEEAKVYDQRPMTPEGQEDDMIAKAFELSRQRLINGTASSSEIVHWLKLGSIRERYEKEKLQEEIKMLKAKTEALKADKERSALYAEAIEAFRKYSPHGPDEI